MTTRTAIAITLLLACATTAAPGQNAGPAVDPQAFASRTRVEQRTTRLLKILGDRRAIPFNNESLTLLLNGPGVGGKAAQEVFRIDGDNYERSIHLAATTNQATTVTGEGAFLVRLDVTLKAGQHIERSAVNQFVNSLQGHLTRALNESIATDRQALLVQQASLLERRAALESQLGAVRNQRLDMIEKAGLAELPAGFNPKTAGELLRKVQDDQIDLAVKQAKVDTVKEQAADPNDPPPDPKTDPLALELEKLMKASAQNLDAITAKKDSTPDDLSRAQMRLNEATVRWMQRREDLANQLPAKQIKLLRGQIGELEARIRATNAAVTDARCRARELFRQEEDITLLHDREGLLAKRLENLDKMLDELGGRVDALQTVSVTMMGEETGK